MRLLHCDNILLWLACCALGAIAVLQQAPLHGSLSQGLSNPPDLKHFTFRHVFHHGLDANFGLHLRSDSTSTLATATAGRREERVDLTTRSRAVTIQRLPSELIGVRSAGSQVNAWTIDVEDGPNPTDKETVLTMAKISSDAYVPKRADQNWMTVGGSFNVSLDFGWQSDGLRGHIFADETNSTVIIGLKGTSPSVFDGADTTTNDKINDNLLFSCCCGQGGHYFWRQVCDGMTGTHMCNRTAITEALRERKHYYQAALELYSNVTEIYPDSTVWLAGHSLGGAVSSLLGMTYGLPTFTFESPPEALAAERLELPAPPVGTGRKKGDTELPWIHHFGHTADPIFMGTCNAATSACTLGGYAMESQCHAGTSCVYDTVGDLGWRVGVGTHSIESVIKNVIQKYETVPKCKRDPECVDCFDWEYYESHDDPYKTTKTTSAASTTSPTSTSVCKTPGWWGCLDKSTTSYATETHRTTLTTTSTTCLTPGWFGCNVESSTTITITTTTKDVVPTTTITLATISSPTQISQTHRDLLK